MHATLQFDDSPRAKRACQSPPSSQDSPSQAENSAQLLTPAEIWYLQENAKDYTADISSHMLTLSEIRDFGQNAKLDIWGKIKQEEQEFFKPENWEQPPEIEIIPYKK